jgi:DNA-binding MarR family transcriptional regulator
MINDDTNLNHVVNFLVEQTARQIRGFGQRHLDALGAGITVDQWILLKIIQEKGQISQVEMAQMAQKDTASVTRILDLLQKKGLIQRMDDDFDRRKYMVSLTPSGEEFVARILPVINQIRAKIVEGISKEEILSLKNVLDKIRRNVV